MLFIPIPASDLPALRSSAGVACRINGESVTMRLVDDYLLYHGDGQDNRCRVLSQMRNGDMIHFTAASHGDDDEDHAVIALGADGTPTDIISEPENHPDAWTTVVARVEGFGELSGQFPMPTVAAAPKIGNMQRIPPEHAEQTVEHGVRTATKSSEGDRSNTLCAALWLACSRGDPIVERTAREGGNTIVVTLGKVGIAIEVRGGHEPSDAAIKDAAPRPAGRAQTELIHEGEGSDPSPHHRRERWLSGGW